MRQRNLEKVVDVVEDNEEEVVVPPPKTPKPKAAPAAAAPTASAPTASATSTESGRPSAASVSSVKSMRRGSNVSQDQYILDLETQIRALRLKIRDLEGSTSQPQSLVVQDFKDGFTAPAGSGWEQGSLDLMSDFLTETQATNRRLDIIRSTWDDAKGTLRDVDVENEELADLCDKTENQYTFDDKKLKVPTEPVTMPTSGSGGSSKTLRDWVEKERKNIKGCCTAMWSKLMDQTVNEDIKKLETALESQPLDDSIVSRVFTECVIQPLTPLFNSTTEATLEERSKEVQECLRKVAQCQKQAAEEREKKTAKSFVQAKKLDKEAQDEQLKLLKIVKNYKDVIMCSTESKIGQELSESKHKASEELEKRLSEFTNSKVECVDDLKEIEQQRVEIFKKRSQQQENGTKHARSFARFLKADRTARDNNLKTMRELVRREKARQSEFVDRCIAELARQYAVASSQSNFDKFVAAVNSRSDAVTQRMQYLDKGEQFMKAAVQLIEGFMDQAMRIIKAQLETIGGKQAMLEELYSKEYAGLKDRVASQETKLKESIEKMKVRIKKKEKELNEAVEAEDVDDIEECESAIEKYKKRLTKMEQELKDLDTVKTDIDAQAT